METLRDHTRLCVRIVSVNVQESASLESVSNRSPSQRMWQSSKNINADAIIAVYPFTRRQLSHSRSSASRMPVFVGVGGGLTGGKRSVRLALQAEHQGAYGVVVNAPIADEVITEIKQVVDIPVIATIASGSHGCPPQTGGGADILNVSGSAATASMVAEIRKEYPTLPLSRPEDRRTNRF